MPPDTGKGPAVSEIKIDAQKLTRLVAQILRDDYGLLPARANEAAHAIETRAIASMEQPSPNVGYALVAACPVDGPDTEQKEMCLSCGSIVSGAAEKRVSGLVRGLRMIRTS